MSSESTYYKAGLYFIGPEWRYWYASMVKGSQSWTPQRSIVFNPSDPTWAVTWREN